MEHWLERIEKDMECQASNLKIPHRNVTENRTSWESQLKKIIIMKSIYNEIYMNNEWIMNMNEIMNNNEKYNKIQLLYR